MLHETPYGPPSAPIFTLLTWDDPAERFAVIDSYRPQNRDPLHRCLQVAEPARCIVVEHEYLDIDYWSEHSYLNEREFRRRSRKTKRLHFFSQQLRVDQVLHLDEVLALNEETPLRERIARIEDLYLGYIVVRPRRTGVVGRSMLRPPAALEDNVRTAVVETVSMFGQPLRVKAVPFMEQDSHTGTCAHTVAWMCHYSAVLRGLIPRHVTVEILERANEAFASERGFPAYGMAPVQLMDVLRHLDLPAIPHTIRTLGRKYESLRLDEVEWNYRAEFLQDVAADSRAAWFREAFTSEAARYLNSGFPLAITQEDHIFLVCGYRREDAPGRPVTSLICHDDQRGPYLEEPVPEQPPKEGGWEELIIPIPNGIWMTGSSAESWGATTLRNSIAVARDRLAALSDEFGDNAAEVAQWLATFEERIDNRDFALRTYAIQSEVFKVSFAHHAGHDRAALETVRQIQLPRFVWVVEVMDRDRRDDPEQTGGSVVGEVVLDATANDLEPNVLFVHLPGVMLVDRPDAIRLCDRGLAYHTSRPSYLPSPELLGQNKAAIVGGSNV